MKNKKALANQIQILQSQATAVCRACRRSKRKSCAGAICSDIIRIVSDIDPLISEYFRMELVEKQSRKLGSAATLPKQGVLPLGLFDEAVKEFTPQYVVLAPENGPPTFLRSSDELYPWQECTAPGHRPIPSNQGTLNLAG